MLDKNITKEEQEIIDSARLFMYEMFKKEGSLKSFLNNKDFSPVSKPSTIFMAGSPGAGKTEYSINFIGSLPGNNFLRIDADELREKCPGYQGINSHLFQAAASIGVDKLYDYSLKNKINVLLDGTFSNYEKSRQNIKRAIDKGRRVRIFYIYQNPERAWDFTKKREKLEKRRITKEIFARDFILAKNNVNSIKKEFGKLVILTVVQKDYSNKDEKIWFNVNNIDDYLKFDYTEESIIQLIK
jgi:hypothetical protein